MAVTNAREITVRDAVIAMINTDEDTITGGIPFECEASWLPEYFKPQLTKLQVNVRIAGSGSTETEVLDRRTPAGTLDRYHFEITYQMQAAIEDTDKIDLLVSIAKRGFKLFEPNTEITGLTKVVVDPEQTPTIDLCDPFYLREFGVFFSKIELVVKEYVSNT